MGVLAVVAVFGGQLVEVVTISPFRGVRTERHTANDHLVLRATLCRRLGRVEPCERVFAVLDHADGLRLPEAL